VTMLRDPLHTDLGRLLDISRKDVFVLCDVKRYERDTVTLAREVRKRGATVVLITDEELSPAAADASVVLPTTVASSSPFHSLATAFVLAELLMVPVMEHLGDDAHARMAVWEDVRHSGLLRS
jgi:DNA-binding MurR/RpiR family transcriptional regulator